MQKEEHIVTYTASELREKIARGDTLTDWDAVDAMTDEEVERNAREDDLEHGPFDPNGPIWVGTLPHMGGIPKLQITFVSIRTSSTGSRARERATRPA